MKITKCSATCPFGVWSITFTGLSEKGDEEMHLEWCLSTEELYEIIAYSYSPHHLPPEHWDWDNLEYTPPWLKFYRWAKEQ